MGVLDRATRYLARLDELDELWHEEVDPFVSLADKVVVESALLALVTGRAPSPSIQEAARRLAKTVAPHARSTRNRALLMRFPHTARSLGIAHVALSRAGVEDSEFDELIGEALASGQLEALERPPFRAMELCWLRALHEKTAPAFGPLIEMSILSTPAHPIYMAGPEAYALTHALMYLTDFGLRQLPAEADSQRCVDMIDASIAWHLIGENLDLLGECLLAASFIGEPWSPYARCGWHALSRSWATLGFLPSPSFDPDQFESKGAKERSAYAFRHVYHTEYVGGMLLAALLRHPDEDSGANGRPLASLPEGKRRGDLRRRCNDAVRRSRAFWLERGIDVVEESKDRWVSSPSHRGLAGTVALLSSSQTAAGRPGALWRSLIDEPSAEASELELETVLCDALLIHACREYELATLASLIARRVRNGSATETTIEAITFLVRQQLPSGAIGAHLVYDEALHGQGVRELAVMIDHALAGACLFLARKAATISERPAERRTMTDQAKGSN